MIITPVGTSLARQALLVPRAAQEPGENRDLGGDQASRARRACKVPRGSEVGVSGCSRSIKEGATRLGAWGCSKVCGRLNLANYFSLVWTVPESYVFLNLSSLHGHKPQSPLAEVLSKDHVGIWLLLMGKPVSWNLSIVVAGKRVGQQLNVQFRTQLCAFFIVVLLFRVWPWSDVFVSL